MLHVHQLKSGYGEKSVLHVPSLSILRGQKCLLRGASGSGKTTLLYALAGIGHIQSGDVTVNDMHLYTMSEAARDCFRGRHIGVVFQTLHLIKSISVWQNIVIGAAINHKQVEEEYVQTLLDDLGIAHLAKKQVTDISQGQAQRVAIARAMVMRPDILLADEPTSSLDDQSTQDVMDLLTRLQTRYQTTLVVASHDARITPYFDQIYTINAEAV